MFEELNFYLSHNVSPERFQLFNDAYGLLLRTEDQSFSDRLDTIMQLADERGDTLTVLDLEICFRTYLEAAIIAHGIELDDDSVSYTVPILKTLLELENYDDPEVVKSTLIDDEDGTPEIIMGKLIELITNMPWTDFLPIIEKVSPSLITRIEEIMEGRSDVFDLKGEDYEFSITPYIVRLKQFKAIHPESGVLLSKLFEQGYKLGSAPDTYIEEVLEELDDLPKEKLLPELVALVLASNVSNDDLGEMCNETIEEFIDDDFKLMYVAKHLPSLLQRISNT